MAILQHPAPGTYSLAGFGPREPIETSLGKSSPFHRGRDFSLGGRSFNVLAARSGIVRWAYYSRLGGNEVLIEHKVPGFDYFATRYGHLASIDPLIRAGVRVPALQRLGPAGATGNTSGVHLHFEVLTAPPDGVSFTQVDPDPFLPMLRGKSAAPAEHQPDPTDEQGEENVRVIANTKTNMWAFVTDEKFHAIPDGRGAGFLALCRQDAPIAMSDADFAAVRAAYVG